MLSSIVLGIAVLFAVLTMVHLLNGGEIIVSDTKIGELPKNRIAASMKKFFKKCYLFNGKASMMEWTAAITAGFGVGLINYFALQINAKVVWLAWVFLVVMIAGYVALVVTWVKGGTELKEAVWFSIVAILAWFPTKTLAIEATAMKAFWALPTIIVIALVAFFVTSAISQREDSNVLVWVLRAIALVLIILILVFTLTGCTSADSKSKEQQPTEGSGETTQQEMWYKFYNLELQKDKDESNDFDFGPNPANKSWTAANYDRDFRVRLGADNNKPDLALAAGDMAWADANLGTRFIGEFYESCKGDWAKTINLAKETWMHDRGTYYKTLEAFLAFLDTAEVEVVEGGQDIEDQMYMNPYTSDKVPDVIVMKTDQKTGLFLIYTFTIKGNEFKVKYRINCGYQPTNVEEIMGITPQDKPTKPSGGGDTPTPSPDNPTPTPSPDNPTPTPAEKQKDPADDPVNNGNAQKGGGDNKPSDGSGEYQAQDPRTEKQNPADVKPDTPAVVPEHQAEEQAGQIVDHEEKMDYTPDPVTDRGPVDQKPPTSSDGDGEFVPSD